MNCDFVQALQSLGLRDAVVYHDGVDVLHIGDADKLVDGGVVALVAFKVGVCGLPLLMRFAEQRHIEYVRFACVDHAHLCTRDLCRD